MPISPDQTGEPAPDEHTSEPSFVMVLNDGETFSPLAGCKIVHLPDDFDGEQDSAIEATYHGGAIRDPSPTPLQPPIRDNILTTSTPSNASRSSRKPADLDGLDPYKHIYAGRSKLRALWGDFPVVVRVHLGALGSGKCVTQSRLISVAGRSVVCSHDRRWTQSAAGAILRLMEPRGAYTAERTAALSGVPKSTVHYWSRKGILIPSVSPERVKLWSYGDLMALRTIYWLRQTKRDPSGREVPRTAMKAVRRALREIAALKLDLWSEDGAPRVAVDRSGGIVIEHDGRAQRPGGQSILDADMLDLLAPFASREGLHGPDLSAPRPRLRIVPGKLGGSPHVVHTRLESQALGALADSGLGEAKIYRLYPDVEPVAIEDALDLERQLAQNLRTAIAA